MLHRIDPATNTVTKTIEVGRIPCELRFAAGSIWVVTQAGKLVRVDPVAGRVVKRIKVGLSYDLAAYGRLDLGVEPRQRHRPARQPEAATRSRRRSMCRPGRQAWPRPAARCGSASRAGRPSTASTRGRTGCARRGGDEGPAWLTAVAGGVWASVFREDVAIRIDALKRTVTASVKVGFRPVNPDRLGGEVWVPAAGDDA